MLKYFILTFLILVSSVTAEDVSDTIFVDTISTDSLLFDTTGINVDTLTDAQRAYQLFLSRQQKRKDKQDKKVEVVKIYLSFYDSLVTTFLHPRLNSSTETVRSFTKDAGDYFRTDPSYFVRDLQQTPSRKTVRPFGLSGNRMNIITNGLVLTPFEHIQEPDGLVDFNDIPTGLTKDIYILPGGVGQLFGGGQSIASLVTVPHQPTNYDSKIRLKVDKGGYDFANTRGGYTKLFTNGKELDLSVDYRNTFGIRKNTDDNSYQYAGRTLIPFNSSYYLTASGNTYRRTGSYKSLQEIDAPHIDRSRTDRNGQIAIEKINDEQNQKYKIEYNYLKQNSNLDNDYKGRFNFFGNTIKLAKESLFKGNMLNSEISYSYLKQTDGINNDSEKSGKALLSMIKKNEHSAFGITSGTIYNSEYKFLPFTSVVYQKFSDNYFMMASLGYSEKAPSMHDVNLTYQVATIYNSTNDYADKGNKYLQSEKQLVGSLMYERGSMKNSTRMTVTGGKIKDGIDWYHADTTLGLISLRLFSPKNSDINFADVQLKQKYSYNDLINLSFGGAYHFIDYESIENRAYQPEYQLFFGGELHHYWKQKWMDLFLYGEVVYSGPYQGYAQNSLGENVVVNTGLAFKIKRFRFYYIFQNSIHLSLPNPDAFTNFGQFSYYGFNWFFIN